MLHRRSLVCFVLPLFGFAAPGLQAQLIPDEVNDLSGGADTWAYILVPPRPEPRSPSDWMYQNFVHGSIWNLAAVDVALFRAPTAPPVTVRILDDQGNELGRAPVEIPPPNPPWFQATFDRPLNLLIASTYTIEVSWEGPNNNLWWWGASGDPYTAAGPHLGDKQPSDVDWGFITYVLFGS